MGRRRRRGEQLALRARTWGGARAGAGRPRTSRRVSHDTRPEHVAREPLHVTLRARRGVPSFRQQVTFRALVWALARAHKSDFRVLHFSFQHDHAHLIVEAADKETLARGAQGMNVRLARALNRAVGRKGGVWADRYHARPLRTPREVRNALVYVLANHKKHAAAVPASCASRTPRERASIDPFSSAPWFSGWTSRAGPLLAPLAVALAAATASRALPRSPAAAPRTWLAAASWQRHGLLDPAESPAPRG